MPDYKPCPKCSSTGATKVGYTWWGGLLGPSLLTHVKCDNCGNAFNGKTGQPNTVGIIVYSVVMFVIVVAVIVALRLFL
jgi:hypothetical protein